MLNRIAIGFICALAVVCGCSRDEPESVTVEETEELPSQEGWNSQLFISEAGRLRAVVHFGHMKKFEKSKTVIFDEGVKVDFYNRDGSHASLLTSDQGRYNEVTEDVVGIGNVVVVSDSGYTLWTEILKWENKREKIVTDTTVMVTTADHDTLYGTGFISNPDLSHLIIKNPSGVSHERVRLEELDDAFSRPGADTAHEKIVPSSPDSAIADSLLMNTETAADTTGSGTREEKHADGKK